MIRLVRTQEETERLRFIEIKRQEQFVKLFHQLVQEKIPNYPDSG